MKKSDARSILSEILKDAPPGEKASVQTEGQASNPHGRDNHVDGWAGTKQPDGNVGVSKIKG